MHRTTFTQKNFYTGKLWHRKTCPQKLYLEQLLHRNFSAQKPFTHRSLYAQQILHRRFYTQIHLHRKTFTHRNLCMQVYKFIYTQIQCVNFCTSIQHAFIYTVPCFYTLRGAMPNPFEKKTHLSGSSQPQNLAGEKCLNGSHWCTEWNFSNFQSYVCWINYYSFLIHLILLKSQSCHVFFPGCAACGWNLMHISLDCKPSRSWGWLFGLARI